MAEDVQDETPVDEPETTPEEKPAEAKPAASAELDQLRADLKAQKDEMVQVRAESERVKTYFGAMVNKIQEVAAKGKPASKEELRERLSEDPEAVLDEMFQARVQPLLHENYKNLDATSRELTKQKLGTTWTKYEKEVDDFMVNMPVDVRARPDAWESALAYVRSRHIDEEVEERVKNKADKSKNMEGASPSASTKAAHKGLSAEEKTIARGLEISDADWIKQRDKVVKGVIHGS